MSETKRLKMRYVIGFADREDELHKGLKGVKCVRELISPSLRHGDESITSALCSHRDGSAVTFPVPLLAGNVCVRLHRYCPMVRTFISFPNIRITGEGGHYVSLCRLQRLSGHSSQSTMKKVSHPASR